jgi:hypothetical protein
MISRFFHNRDVAVSRPSLTSLSNETRQILDSHEAIAAGASRRLLWAAAGSIMAVALMMLGATGALA